MINQNHPPNSLINVIQKKYNSCDGGISNRIFYKISLLWSEDGDLYYWISGVSAFLQTEFFDNYDNDATVNISRKILLQEFGYASAL